MDRKALIYTDGSCLGNPGPGGYAAVVLINGATRETHGSDWYTTNNRMELTAVIEGLKLLPEPCTAHIISDSRYIVNTIQVGNLRGYVQEQKRSNLDLWQQILRLSVFHTLTAEWVKSHSGNRLNQRCDRLARDEAKRVQLEQGTRILVFRELLADVMATPEKIAAKYGIRELDTIQKYYSQFYERRGHLTGGC